MPIDWKCTNCGFKPSLDSPLAYDGWIRFELGRVIRKNVTRVDVFTMCSIDCVVVTLDKLKIAAGMADVKQQVDEIDDINDEP